MKPDTQAAYRDLLYLGMAHIRNCCPQRLEPSWNPMRWRRAYVSARLAGLIADWLHNLAEFGVCDFDGFDEQIFWNEHESLAARHTDFARCQFRQRFEAFAETQKRKHVES